MKKIISTLVLGLGISAGAMAADGTITFNGTVLATTCNITIAGGTAAATAATGTVNLPIVPASVFTAAGDTSFGTAFTIGLSGCNASLNGKTAAFHHFAGTSIKPDGRLNNTGTATNMAIALYSGTGLSGTFINLNSALNTPTQTVTGAAATFPLFATYSPTATPVVAGTVVSNVDFFLNYY